MNKKIQDYLIEEIKENLSYYDEDITRVKIGDTSLLGYEYGSWQGEDDIYDLSSEKGYISMAKEIYNRVRYLEYNPKAQFIYGLIQGLELAE